VPHWCLQGDHTCRLSAHGHTAMVKMRPVT
jgi:hypothetical protein